MNLNDFKSRPFRVRLGEPAVLLAPMEGVIDATMRDFLSGLGPEVGSEVGGIDACVSEFIRISQDIPPRRVFLRHIPELAQGGATPSGVPVQVQLLGGSPEKLAEAAIGACEAGAWGVDLNFGCPAPTVNRHDGGAVLLKSPHRIRAIIEAVRRAVPQKYPVSAKFRLGWDSMEMIHVNADQAAEAGVSWITIHGRTKVQGYTPPAYWKPIGEVRSRLGSGVVSSEAVPVVANGEIWTYEDFLRCQGETGCEHFMLGRGALANPYLSGQIRKTLKGQPQSSDRLSPSDFSMMEWNFFLRCFVEVCASYGIREGAIVRRIKQWMGLIVRRWPLLWIDPLKRAETLDEIFFILN